MIDPTGNLFVAILSLGTVVKITPAGVVSTFATTGTSPTGMVIDSTGNLYTANYNSGTVSKITPAGVVSTFVTTG